MKRMLIGLFAVAALIVAAYGYAFDLNLKKKSCEAACDKTYEECMKSEGEKEKDAASKLAQEQSCAAAKDECYKKCSK